jgi:hypothetical protein
MALKELAAFTPEKLDRNPEFRFFVGGLLDWPDCNRVACVSGRVPMATSSSLKERHPL